MAINLAGLKKPASKAAKKDLPIFPDPDGELKEQADELARLCEAETAAETGKQAIQAEFKSLVRPHIFDINHGRGTVQATISIVGNEAEILVALKDAYITTEDLEEVTLILGEERANKLFNQVFAITIDSKLIPEDSQQAVVDDIRRILTEYGCPDSMSAKSSFKPTKAFATERHTALTAEENIALEGINGGKGLTVMSVAPSRGRK